VTAVATPGAGLHEHARSARSGGGTDARSNAAPSLSRPAYLLLTAALLAAYGVAWLAHFQYVYGINMDDYTVYLKAAKTAQDWHAAFTFFYNALQPYYLLISYLPLKSGAALPSYEVPLLGAQTGPFRFLLLYTLVLHALLLATWAWFASRLTDNRLVAWLSLLLFASSPTLILWSPKPDSRLLGLPFALVGAWLLFRPSANSSARPRTRAVALFLAGSLMTLAQAIHYTALYLVVPLCLIFWAVKLSRDRRQRRSWLGLACFVGGAVWPQAALEAVSYFLVGIPIDHGPTSALLLLRNEHASDWAWRDTIAIWATSFATQMGVLLLFAIVVGWLQYARGFRRGAAPEATRDLVLGLCIPMALGYLVLSGAMPFFRQTSLLQPFLFLFAAVGIVWLATRLTRATRLRGALVVGFLLLVGAVPWRQAQTVFQAQQALGRALEWAYANKGDRQLEWLPIGDSAAATVLTDPRQVLPADPHTWVVSYFPWQFLATHGELRPALEATPPLAAWPSFYATDALWAEARGFGHYDLRADPLLSEVRIYDAAALLQARDGEEVSVASVAADSTAAAETEPANVFDQGRSPDGNTAWVSDDTPLPHILEIALAQPTPLGELAIVLPSRDQSAGASRPFASRIAALDVQLAQVPGQYRTVWRGEGLENYASVHPVWSPATVVGIRLVVRAQTFATGPTSQAAIEEVVFPGHASAAPRPQRPLPPLILQAMRVGARGLTVSGTGLTARTTIAVDGQPLPTTLLDTGELQLRPPYGVMNPDEPHRIALTDGLRQSNVALWPPQPALLRALHPDTFPLEAPAGAADDGRTLHVDADNATPTTAVMFDTVTLPTTYQDERTLTAHIPGQFLTQAGQHTIRLRNAEGDSNPLTLTIAGPGGLPPVLEALEPARATAGELFNAQADDTGALRVTGEHFTPSTVVVLSSVMLATRYEDEHTLVASVPREFLAYPVQHLVTVQNSNGQSEPLELIVAP